MTIRFRSPAQRAYTWRVGLAMGVYLVSLPAAVHFVGQGVVSRTVDWHVAVLRKRLGPVGARLRTVRGAGYKWE